MSEDAIVMDGYYKHGGFDKHDMSHSHDDGHEETWEEHKKRFHHGREPKGRCEWLDSHGTKWIIPDVKPKRKPAYGTEWFYGGGRSSKIDSGKKKSTYVHTSGHGDDMMDSYYGLSLVDELSTDYSGSGSGDRWPGGIGVGLRSFGKRRDYRPLEKRMSEVEDKVKNPCDALFDELVENGISFSPELKKFSIALMCGLDVDNKEIEKIPEVKAASEKYDEYASDRKKKGLTEATGYDYSGERTELRKSILDAFSKPKVDKSTNGELDEGESYTVEQGKRIDIITGSPASGKSSTFAAPLSRKYKSRLCDPDQIKTMIPEYADGLGAGIVHNESKVLCRDVMYYAMDRGDNIVFPTLGGDGNTGRLLRIIEDAHARGYQVHLHYNKIDHNKAIGRMLYRLAQTGRFIPLHYFDTGFDYAYDKAKKFCDSAERVEQGAGKGVEPKKTDEVHNSLPDGKFKKTNEARTSYFYAAERMTPLESKTTEGDIKDKGEDGEVPKGKPMSMRTTIRKDEGEDEHSGKTPDEILYDWYVG